MKRSIGVALVIFLQISRSCQQSGDNPCTTKVRCGECIVTDARCAWCSSEDFSSDENRCNLREQHNNCERSFLVSPETGVAVVRSEELSDGGGDSDPVQLKPQHVKIITRPKARLTFPVEFRQAKNYPVDLYYLMDLSYTMKNDKEKLEKLGEDFANTMGQITDKYLLGFGSFVDKTILPYTDTSPSKLKAPCTGCAAPYGFRNHLSLDRSTTQFAKEVESSKVSGNLDSPEGGLDAMMQVAVCKREIGWRNQSRKLLVFATDSGFHYAGDGRLAGILTPNDGECHLDNSGEYTESLNQDYPSIRHLNQKIEENNINVIFAVTKDQRDVYLSLSEELKGSTTGELSEDSANVIDLIRDQYRQITSSVELRHTADKDVRVTYHSSCLGSRRQETNVCSGLGLGIKVTFDVEIEVLSCPSNKKDTKKTITISPVGLNEILTVDIETTCECECEKEGKKIPKSDLCSSGNGSYECGICNCYENRYGQKCQCDATAVNLEFPDTACRKDNTSEICSGKGECKCGVCECKSRKNSLEKIYGKYCQCDNFSCNKINNQFCGGPERGTCDCGECKCNTDWTGPECSCRASNNSCKSPDGKICSGHGTCECDSCKCTIDQGEEIYSGVYCEECPTCPSKCQLYKDCVECSFSNDTSTESCLNCSSAYNITVVDKVEAFTKKERICNFPDVNNCKLIFKYMLNDRNEPIIHVQKTKECPTPVNALVIGLGVTGGIIAIGLALLLILKLLTYIHDQREWVKFEKERQMAKWDESGNPIYQQPTSTFMNPTYGN